MFKFIQNRQIAKRLRKIGDCVDQSYLLYINSLEPVSFNSIDVVLAYIKQFRENSPITHLQIYRVITYSL